MEVEASRSARLFALFLGIWSTFASAGGEGVEPPELVFEPEKVGWTRLELTASAWGIKARTQVELALGQEEASSDTATPSDAEPPGPGAVLTLESRFLGLATHEKICFNPVSGTASSSRRSYSGRKHYAKDYAFDGEGVRIRRSAPAEGEDVEAPESWSRVAESAAALPVAVERGRNQANALLYLLSASTLSERGDEIRLPLYSGDGWLWVTARVSGLARIRVRYREVRGEESRERDEILDALVIQLRGKSMHADDEAEPMEMMGLEGDLRVYLDTESRVPLRISGKAKVVGKLDIKLKEVRLADP